MPFCERADRFSWSGLELRCDTPKSFDRFHIHRFAKWVDLGRQLDNSDVASGIDIQPLAVNTDSAHRLGLPSS